MSGGAGIHCFSYSLKVPVAIESYFQGLVAHILCFRDQALFFHFLFCLSFFSFPVSFLLHDSGNHLHICPSFQAKRLCLLVLFFTWHQCLSSLCQTSGITATLPGFSLISLQQLQTDPRRKRVLSVPHKPHEGNFFKILGT